MTYFRSSNGGDIENVQLIPSSGGAFEVTVNGEKIYSKLEEGRFPEEQAIFEKMQSVNE